MGKNKKIILIIAIMVIAASIITTFLLINKNEEQKIDQVNKQEEEGISKLITIKNNLENGKNYIISLTLNDENKKITSRNNNAAKLEMYDEGELKTYLVKENDTYLLIDSTKTYYEYKNNNSLLNDFINNMEDVIALNYTIGNEEIEGKNYRYEEFLGTNSFILNYKGNIDNESSKTRFYFDGSDLKYIKTFVGNVEQLLKVEIETNIQNEINFDIPEDYNK